MPSPEQHGERVGGASEAPEELLPRGPRHLAFDPGTDWFYGMGIDVLGRVIEVVSGKNLDEFLRKTIFEPL